MPGSSRPTRNADRSASMFGRIREAILKIPRGRVATYGGVARAAGFAGAARQVVWALRQSRGLPWHRVLAAGGRIALPGEAGFEQRLRLEAEGVRFAGAKVKMEECEFVFRSTTSRRMTGRRIQTSGPRAKAGKTRRK